MNLSEQNPNFVHGIGYFDRLVRDGDLDKAHRVIDTISRERALTPNPLAYDPRFYQARLRSIAMPLYRRYEADFAPSTDRQEQEGIGSIYTDAVALLKTLSQRYRTTRRSRTAQENPEMAKIPLTKLSGDMSELIVFCLTARQLQGTESDEFTILPAEILHDAGKVGADGLRTGFDFTVMHRPTRLQIPIQVKTTPSHAAEYIPEVAMVYISELASAYQDPSQIRHLKQAIIADGEGRASDNQIDHIEQARRRLEYIYLTKLIEFSKQIKTA